MIPIFEPVIPTAEIPNLEIPSAEPEFVVEKQPPRESIALESTVEVSLSLEGVAFEVAMEEPPIQEVVAPKPEVEEAHPKLVWL